MRFVRIFGIVWTLWFLSGVFLFPHAPIAECEQPNPAMYCGKYGVPSTEAEYLRYQVWEKALFMGFFLLALAGIWLRLLAASGDEEAIAYMKRPNGFGFRTLWALRGLALTYIAVYLVGLMLGPLFPGERPIGSWLGGALATLPAYLLGVVVQHRIDPTALREHKSTVWILGVIAVAVFAFAVKFLVEGRYAG